MNYSNRFNTLTVEVLAPRPVLNDEKKQLLDAEGNPIYEEVLKKYKVTDLRISNSDVFLVSLAILADVQDKANFPNARNNGFVNAYREVHGKLSLETIAQRVVALYDNVKNEEFASEMFYSWKLWGRGKMVTRENKKVFVSETYDDECNYDPFVFSSREKSTSLSNASLTLLAKGLRFFLEETLRHFFHKPYPSSWYPYTDKKGKKVLPECFYQGNRTSASFSGAVEELLELYNSVNRWTPHLDEFAEATAKAVEAGNVEKAAKEAARQANFAKNRSYGKTDDKKQVENRSTEKKPEKKVASSVTTSKKPKIVHVVDEEGWTTNVKSK